MTSHNSYTAEAFHDVGKPVSIELSHENAKLINGS